MTGTGWLPEAFLEHCPACQWTIDREGYFHAIYGDSSPLFDKTASELQGQPTSSLGTELAPLWSNRFARVFDGEILNLRERRGNSTWYVTVFPIRREGQVVFAGGLAREITPWSTAEQELRRTVLSALKAQEFQRRMASQFLHDSVGQTLTALGLQLDLLRMDLEGVAPESSVRILEIQKILEEMMEQVREYSYELNPSTVERAGLRAALDRLSHRMGRSFHSAIRINVDPSLKLDPKMATAFYHIAEEAVENAAQHSSCSVIEIAVKSTRSGPLIEVHDDGRGFDPGDIPGAGRGLGLLSMEHYAAQAGLDLSIASSRDTGTVVRAVSLRVP